ncbi:MAG: ComF family protein, partial [Bacilli bacterium]
DSLVKKCVYERFRKLYGDDVICIYVPMHPEKERERGFNPAQVIAEFTRVPYWNAFEKTENITQGLQSRKERAQLERVFQRNNFELNRDKKYVVVDDIYTTGSTVQSMLKVLRNENVTTLGSFTLFRA